MKATRGPLNLVLAQSTATNYTSPAYDVSDIDVQAVQIDYTGSPSGTFAIQGSINRVEDSQGNVIVPGTFSTLYFSVNGSSPSASVAVPTNPSPIIFDMYGSGVQFIEVVYTGTGTGTFTAVVVGKRLGD